jgi:Iron-containing redox enzyme
MVVSYDIVSRLVDETESLQQISALKFGSAVKSLTSYGAYLVQTYHYVVASVPLMQAAVATEFARSQLPFKQYLTHHIEEENGHEKWLLDDLSLLGYSEASVRGSVPLPEVAQLAGAQYYTIFHWHPLGLLGYIYALESAPPNSEFLNTLTVKYGIPLAALGTLYAHALDDVDHRESLLNLLRSLELDNFQEETIIHSACNTLRSLIGILNALSDMSEQEIALEYPR